jgi:hypothetical protein
MENGPGDPFHFFRLIATRLEWGVSGLRNSHEFRYFSNASTAQSRALE